LKPFPEAIEWLGKEPVERYLDLLRAHPAQQAIDEPGKDHPAHGGLMKILTSSFRTITMRRTRKNELFMYIDFRWLTEGKGYSEHKTWTILAEKYPMDKLSIRRAVFNFRDIFKE
jgi:hypothetical protein